MNARKGDGWSQPVPSAPACCLSCWPCWRVIHPSIHPHVRLCVVHRFFFFFTARMGPRPLGRGHWAEPGPFTDWAATRSISLSGDRTPGRGTGILSSAQGPLRVHGAHGVQAIQSQVPNPPAGVSLVDIARAVGGGKLLISCPDPKPRKKFPGPPNQTLRPFIPETSRVTIRSLLPAQQSSSYPSQPGRVQSQSLLALGTPHRGLVDRQ